MIRAKSDFTIYLLSRLIASSSPKALGTGTYGAYPQRSIQGPLASGNLCCGTHRRKRRCLICNALQIISIAITRRTGCTNTRKSSRPQVVIQDDMKILIDDILKLMVISSACSLIKNKSYRMLHIW